MRMNPKIDVNHPPILNDLGCALETNRGLKDWEYSYDPFQVDGMPAQRCPQQLQHF